MHVDSLGNSMALSRSDGSFAGCNPRYEPSAALTLTHNLENRGSFAELQSKVLLLHPLASKNNPQRPFTIPPHGLQPITSSCNPYHPIHPIPQ